MEILCVFVGVHCVEEDFVLAECCGEFFEVGEEEIADAVEHLAFIYAAEWLILEGRKQKEKEKKKEKKEKKRKKREKVMKSNKNQVDMYQESKQS